jgi:hypothetical protein
VTNQTEDRELPHDAVFEMGHAAGLVEPCPLQLDSLRKLVEEPSAPSEQDVDQVDPDLVHEPGGEELRPMSAPISPMRLSPAASRACASALSIPSPTNVKGGPELAGDLWVTTKHATSPSGPLPPQFSVELS